MIKTRPAPASTEGKTSPTLETDPVKIIARAMIELDAQGRTVTVDALMEKTMLTRAEVEKHVDDARDHAHTTLRKAA